MRPLLLLAIAMFLAAAADPGAGLHARERRESSVADLMKIAGGRANAEVRARAVGELQHRAPGDRTLARFLVGLLDDEAESVRAGAAEALRGRPAFAELIVPALAAALDRAFVRDQFEQPGYWGSYVCNTLAGYGEAGRAAVPHLERYLVTSEVPFVAEALGRIGGPRALRALVGGLQEHMAPRKGAAVSYECAEAIGQHMGDEALAPVWDSLLAAPVGDSGWSWRSAGFRALEALAARAPSLVPFLVGHLASPRGRERALAAQVLGRVAWPGQGWEAADRAIVAMVDAARTSGRLAQMAADDPDEAVREAAAAALWHVTGPPRHILGWAPRFDPTWQPAIPNRCGLGCEDGLSPSEP